jgi:hypothetical protein
MDRIPSGRRETSRASIHSIVSSHPSHSGSDEENSPETNHTPDDSSGPPISLGRLSEADGPSREYLVRRRRLFKGRHIQMMAFGNHSCHLLFTSRFGNRNGSIYWIRQSPVQCRSNFTLIRILVDGYSVVFCSGMP